MMMYKGRKHTRLKAWMLFRLITMLAATLLIFGCGGGGGDGSSTAGPEGQSDISGGSGSVALYLADAPVDDFDHIWIKVSEIALIPCAEDGEPQVLFQSDEPQSIDLLELRDDNDLLLAIEEGVDTGEYCKIRLEVDGVAGDIGGETIHFNLPSDRIDFNPQGSFQVEAGETLSIRIDIDAAKSIHISGPNYNFRPVVFVDFDEIDEPRPCRHLLRGQIEELIYATSGQADTEETSEASVSEAEASETEASETVDGDLLGFRLKMFSGFSSVDVLLQEETVIFDEAGSSVGIDALAVDQVVGVKGRLDSEGRFLAELVVIGSVVKVFGIVETPVDETGTFTLRPAGFSPVTGEGTIAVSLTDDTSIMMGGTQVDKTMIQPNQHLKVVGKYDADAETLNAVAIFIKPSERTGILTAMEAVQGGSLLTIQVDPMTEAAAESADGEEIMVLLPEATAPQLAGKGDLSLAALAELITCDPPRVRVILSQEPTEDEPAVAMALEVLPLMMAEVTVERITDGVITTTEGDTIQVPEAVDVWSHTFSCQTPYLPDEIQAGDTLMVSAIKTCEPTTYQAVLILKVGPLDPSEVPCFPKHEMVELTVAEMEEAAIEGDDGTVVFLTDETRFLDHTLEFTQGPPTEFSLEEIEVGDVLVCHVRIPCDSEENVAILVIRVDPDTDGVPPPDGDLIPPGDIPVQKETVVIETVADGVITTTEEAVILYTEDTVILRKTGDNIESVESSELAPGQQIHVRGRFSCEYEAADGCVTAFMIIISDTDSEV
jgi:hypothetical protein